MAAMVASTPCLLRLKSTRRIFCLCPPPMPREVMRPYILRPPVFLRISTSDFSGFVFVISLKSAIVMYRVDGVSGLNVLTGIIAKVFNQQLLEVGRPSILSLAGKSVIGLQTMLSCYRPYGRRGAGTLSEDEYIATPFLNIFG